MDPISIAMGLAQFAPQVVKWLTGSDKAEAAAGKVVEIANAVTGLDNGADSLRVIGMDPQAALAFRQAVMANEADLDKAFLADVQSARSRDVEFLKSGQRNYRAEFMFMLAVLMIGVLVWIIWRDQSINEYVKGIFTLVLGRFLGYLDNIYNFEFGTTRSSRVKDNTIDKLSG